MAGAEEEDEVARVQKSQAATEIHAIKRDLVRYAVVIFGFLTALFVIEVVNTAMGGGLNAYGVRPRSVPGLVGVLAHPLLHGGFPHLIGNSIGLFVFGWIIVLREESHLYIVTATTWLLGGLGIWTVGAADSVHVGASGLVFGLFGYLLSIGIFERRLGTVLLSLFVAFTWGGMIFGVLPGQTGISWEGHLFGFFAGVLAAKLLANRRDAD